MRLFLLTITILTKTYYDGEHLHQTGVAAFTRSCHCDLEDIMRLLYTVVVCNRYVGIDLSYYTKFISTAYLIFFVLLY